MRLSDKLNFIIQLLLPWFHLVEANKRVRDKIKKIENGEVKDNIDYMKGFENLSLDEVKKFFEKTLYVKKSLEDKLKTSLFSVTLGITVLTSTISFLFNNEISSLSAGYKGLIFFTGSIAIIYMILAGIFAIKTISGFISVYQLFPEDIAGKSDEEQRDSLGICAELNSLSNIIRQNLMNISFHCIINSLFVIVILFFLLGGCSFIIKKNSSKLGKIDIIVHPNQDNIDLLKAKILQQRITLDRDIKSIKKKMASQSLDITGLNNILDEISKEVAANKQKINSYRINNKKSSNKSLHTDVDSAPLHPRR